ncbi:MAG TPA: polysaccharide deacetylase family protein [Bryobacteraceae bacterium]|nr:polysaccharide deacetylase family protein [Bryobacteraceae bacterium]
MGALAGMRKRVKRAAFGVLQRAGLSGAFARSRWRRERLIILCYHGISLEDEHLWDPTLYMSVDDFARRLEILRRGGYRVLPLGEAVERLYKGDLPPQSVAITFDDGAYDFYARAWPLLRSFDYPATVYLTTYYCGDNRPVFDPAVSYLLWKMRGRVFGNAPAGLPWPLDLRTEAARRAAWQRILAFAAESGFPAGDKDALLERLAALAGIDYAGFRARRILHIMNPREVAELHATGLDVQLHTHRHRTPVDRALFLREVRENRDEIRALTGAGADHFCYPCGVNRPEFLPWLEQAQVRTAVTCEPRAAARDSHPLLLPRFVDHANLSEVEFSAYVSGLGLFVPNEARNGTRRAAQSFNTARWSRSSETK